MWVNFVWIVNDHKFAVLKTVMKDDVEGCVFDLCLAFSQ